MWYVIYSNKKSKPDPVRDANYKALMRIDYNNWSYFQAMFTHFFFWPRLILGLGAFFTSAIVAVIIGYGHDPFHLPEWKARIVRFGATVAA